MGNIDDLLGSTNFSHGCQGVPDFTGDWTSTICVWWPRLDGLWFAFFCDLVSAHFIGHRGATYWVSVVLFLHPSTTPASINARAIALVCRPSRWKPKVFRQSNLPTLNSAQTDSLKSTFSRFPASASPFQVEIPLEMPRILSRPTLATVFCRYLLANFMILAEHLSRMLVL